MTESYRYTLERVIPAVDLFAGPPARGTLLFCMLNPSTATASQDDPTIRRCIDFATRWGFARMEVVNLYAARSTDPAQIRRMSEPVGEKNDEIIVGRGRVAEMVVAAWGAHPAARDNARDQHVLRLLTEQAGQDVHALAFTADGAPQHPLFVPKATTPVLYRRAAAA